MGDHSEAIEIVYDPDVVSFEDLLGHFWSGHRPTNPPWSRQYRSAIFVHDADQRAAAEASLKARATELGAELYTAIEPAGVFTPAEAYHQKYRLKGSAVAEAFSDLYPDPHDWVGSTAAARLNGWVAGYGDPEVARKELAQIGLPDEVTARIMAELE